MLEWRRTQPGRHGNGHGHVHTIVRAHRTRHAQTRLANILTDKSDPSWTQQRRLPAAVGRLGGNLDSPPRGEGALFRWPRSSTLLKRRNAISVHAHRRLKDGDVASNSAAATTALLPSLLPDHDWCSVERDRQEPLHALHHRQACAKVRHHLQPPATTQLILSPLQCCHH
jgi:hypothetical protein